MSLLSIRDLDKSYSGIPALSGVSLDLVRGEVHALMGENGAGKSTLIRILAGVTAADRIDARLDGAALMLSTSAEADRAGLRFVHQELNIVPALSVAENIFLGHSIPRRMGLAVDWGRLNAQAAEALDRFGVRHIDPRMKAGRLGVGDRMLIRLASMLVGTASPARVFVLDEPTAALTHAESDRLFRVIDELTRAGAAILYVSHRIDEVLALAQRVTV
ncbi:MAG TPA: ATP-binding cassette domain-containing protein, partial [Rubellimicrobium sp.]|nr:ATP-binding cassette domain-containing protein [Rubellimicrobium sp.]